jgi:hypothetical protein
MLNGGLLDYFSGKQQHRLIPAMGLAEGNKFQINILIYLRVAGAGASIYFAGVAGCPEAPFCGGRRWR